VNSLWPVLTIIEDDAPPTYERIALQEGDATDKGEETEKPTYSSGDSSSFADEAGGSGSGSSQPPVTSNLRTLNRTLYAIEGWPSLLRGLRPHMVLNFSLLGISALLASIPFVPDALAIACAPLVIIQLYTAWIHIAIAAPSSKSVLSRFPRYGTAFRATALPLFAMYFAIGLSQELPLLVVRWIGFETWDPTGYAIEVPYFDGRLSDWAKLLAMLVAYLLPTIFLVIPMQVILTRIQASLLPAEERTIIPFDRTFGGEREKGQGYISFAQAWRSFSTAAWLRLAKMYVKVFIITLTAATFIAGAVAIQVITVWNNMKKENDS
jgi:hypothetical protein